MAVDRMESASSHPHLRLVSRYERPPSPFRRFLINCIKPFVGPIEEYQRFMREVEDIVGEEDMVKAKKMIAGDGVLGAIGTVGEHLPIAASAVKLVGIVKVATSKEDS